MGCYVSAWPSGALIGPSYPMSVLHARAVFAKLDGGMILEAIVAGGPGESNL